MRQLPVYTGRRLTLHSGNRFYINTPGGHTVCHGDVCRELVLDDLYDFYKEFVRTKYVAVTVRHHERVDVDTLKLVLDHTVGLVSMLYSKEPFVGNYNTKQYSFPHDTFTYNVTTAAYKRFTALLHLLLKFMRDAPHWACGWAQYITPATQEEINEILSTGNTEAGMELLTAIIPNWSNISLQSISKLPFILDRQYPVRMNRYQSPYGGPRYWSGVRRNVKTT